MKYRMVDGKEYSGRSYDDIVQKMSQDKLTEVRSVEGYRRATAQRVSEMYEVIVDATDSRSFIHSLEAAGLMEKVA